MPYSSSGGSWWEWLGTGQVSKRTVRIDLLPSTAGAYSDPIRQDLLKPTKTHQFKGRGLSYSELTDLIAAIDTRGATVTIVDKNGKTHTGVPLALSYPDIEGIDSLYEVDLQLEV